MNSNARRKIPSLSNYTILRKIWRVDLEDLDVTISNTLKSTQKYNEAAKSYKIRDEIVQTQKWAAESKATNPLFSWENICTGLARLAGKDPEVFCWGDARKDKIIVVSFLFIVLLSNISIFLIILIKDFFLLGYQWAWFKFSFLLFIFLIHLFLTILSWIGLLLLRLLNEINLNPFVYWKPINSIIYSSDHILSW